MRRANIYTKILKYKGIMVIIERIKNDYYGNPRYRVQYINTKTIFLDEITNNQVFTKTSYSIEKDVMDYIDKNNIENYTEYLK